MLSQLIENQDGRAQYNQYADWRDASTWPVSSRQSEAIRHTISQQADPLTKPGSVGAFCRAYRRPGVSGCMTTLIQSTIT